MKAEDEALEIQKRIQWNQMKQQSLEEQVSKQKQEQQQKMSTPEQKNGEGSVKLKVRAT